MVRKLNLESFDKVLTAANNGTLESVTIYLALKGKNRGNHMMDYKISAATIPGSPLNNPTHRQFMDCLRTIRGHLTNNDFATIELNYVVDAKLLKFRVVGKKSVEQEG